MDESPRLKYPAIMPDFEMIESELSMVVYGDDNIMSIGGNLIGFVNQTTLTKAMMNIGFTYTPEDKSDAEYLFRPIEECTFLKCSFKYNKTVGRYVAPQMLESILDMPYWTTSNNGEPMSVENTVQLLLDKLSLWGPDIFAKYSVNILNAAATELNYYPVRQDYKSCLQYICSYEAYFL